MDELVFWRGGDRGFKMWVGGGGMGMDGREGRRGGSGEGLGKGGFFSRRGGREGEVLFIFPLFRADLLVCIF